MSIHPKDSELYKYQNEKAEEVRKRWHQMRAADKHYCLMYLYRLKTVDHDEIPMYIETKKFHDLKISIDDLPDFTVRMSAKEIKKEAYAVIGM